MEQLNLAIALCGLIVVAMGLVSSKLQNTPLSAPLIALAAGVAAGPFGLNWLNTHGWTSPEPILKEAARFTLAISVFGVGIRTPPQNFTRLARPVGILLTLGMVAMWAVSSAVAWAVLGVAPLMALLLGAIVTPTDPVVASSIVTGNAAERMLPDYLRSTLSLESGANDGLGYLIVMLPILLMTASDAAWSRWLWDVLAVGILLAVAIGVAVGSAGAWLLHRADKAQWVEKHSLLGMSVAMSLMVLAGAHLIGSDGILAAFAAGAAFNVGIDRQEDLEEQQVQEAISKLLNLPIFVLLGAMLPLAAWSADVPRLALFAVAVLLLRRPLAVAACTPFLGGGLQRRDDLFLGWFGPVGVAALYYALLAQEKTGEGLPWHATSFVIAASVAAHGLTSGPGVKLYARRAAPA